MTAEVLPYVLFHFIQLNFIQPGIGLEFVLALLIYEQVNGWEWQSFKGRAWAQKLISITCDSGFPDHISELENISRNHLVWALASTQKLNV